MVDGATQVQLANEVVSKRLSVRDTEKLVSNNNAPDNKIVALKEKSRDIKRLEEELSDLLALKVIFKMGKKGRGQLIMDFETLDSIEGILNKLRT